MQCKDLAYHRTGLRGLTRHLKSALLLLLVPVGTPASAQTQTLASAVVETHCPPLALTPGADPLDQLVVKDMRAGHVPGASVVVLRNGSVSKVRGYGYADLESCVPTTSETLFGIGSISKQFTAVGVLTLVRDGRLSLDDPITKYLPEGKGVWDGILVRHLLTHTSGIPDYCGDDAKFPSISLDRTSNPSTSDLLRQIAKAPLNFRPGDDWAYSNTGYLVLGALIERVSHERFADFMRQRVFLPLGMKSTRYYSPVEVIAHAARPYHQDDNGTVTRATFISDQFSHWGDMGMLSTAREMGNWLSALGRDKLLRPALWRQMLSPVRLNDGTRYPYGFGIDLIQVGANRGWVHSGSFRVGYSAMMMKYPDAGLAVAVLSNSYGIGGVPEGMAFELAGTLVPAVEPASMRSARTDPQPALTQGLANLLKGLDQEHGAAPTTDRFRLHDNLHILAAKMAQHMPDLTLEFLECGALQSQSAPAAFGVPVARQCAYRIAGAPGAPGLVFWLTKDNAVAGLSPL